jgi:DNA topoisomerase I
MSSVVVVESPAKAKTINKYLGSDYTVLASYGHVRDLPPKDGSVRPDDNFSMSWQIDDKSQKHVREIAKALKGADRLYLATDPDREGEAISWHVQEILNATKSLDTVDVKRVVFNEITKDAILAAFETPRELDNELIEAYLARRALDYLVGFTLSPVLWRKLPGSRSAGRVQSVALRLICERETEIENFVSREYWSIKALMASPSGATFEAGLTHLNGEKLDKMDLGDNSAAMAAVTAIEARSFSVQKIERKKTRRHPAPPFTTSTLQQEASRKLRFGARRTMQVAQRLYEGIQLDGETVGLITYMRTDGVQIANEAIASSRALIGRDYGEAYVPGSPRIYKSKAKNAQEAHEAVRPTDLNRRPADVASYLDDDQRRLYELIWKRTIASQMESAVLDQVAVEMGAPDNQVALRATGSVIAFDGFLRLYQEGRDDSDKEATSDTASVSEDRILPPLNEGDAVERRQVTPEQHFTQPPPRYSEASLVKKLEELGIGRPSTYASIITVLQDRNYVRLEKRRFEPEDRGRVVTAFLESFFTRYVAYDFTADLEEKLDDISGGRADWKTLLRDFWGAFSEAVNETKDLRISEVLDNLDALLGPHFFRDTGNGKDPRKCPSCADGRMNLKLGKFGAFIGCSNYPDCRFTRPLEVSDGSDEAIGNGEPKELGLDPETNLMVTLRKGPYGWYVQLGEVEEIVVETKGKKPKTKKTKPKRGSVPKTLDPSTIDLQIALGLLALPRDVGPDPETGEMITAAIGRFGPYIKLGGTYVSLKGDDDVLTIGLNRAIHLMANAPRKDPAREIGKHPKDKKPITQRQGRWGPYVQHGRLMATLPKDMDKDSVTIEQAVALLKAKAAKKNKGGKKSTSRRKLVDT